MSWLDKLLPSRVQTSDKKQIPDDLWSKCDSCNATIYTAELIANQYVCPKCKHHMRIKARTRLQNLFDKDSLSEIAADIKPIDKLKFKDSKTYKDRIKAAQKSTGENEALVAFSGELNGKPLVAAAFEFKYMGGSMGAVVGEKFVRAVEKAIELNAPFVCFSASGGARMQEGLISLMQMSKTSAALTRLSDKKLPFVSVLTDPTMGGVSASFAMLGDLIIAEPKALIGFAGPRVIEQTVRETLPEGFQRSEFLLEKGAIDMIVSRLAMRDTLTSLFSSLMFTPESQTTEETKTDTDNTDNTDNTVQSEPNASTEAHQSVEVAEVDEVDKVNQVNEADASTASTQPAELAEETSENTESTTKMSEKHSESNDKSDNNAETKDTVGKK